MATATPADFQDFSSIEKEAKSLTADGDVEEAKKMYKNFIENGRRAKKDTKVLALARNNLGHLRYLTVDFHGAVQDYTAAIELDPCLAVPYYNRGQIHYRMGRFKMAISDFERALELDQNFADARENLRQAKEDFSSKNINLTLSPNSNCNLKPNSQSDL